MQLSFLSLLAAAALGVAASEELKIDVTVPVECDRKTAAGDNIQVHYKGTLLSNGNKFDASQSAPALLSSSSSCRPAPSMLITRSPARLQATIAASPSASVSAVARSSRGAFDALRPPSWLACPPC